jgi:hypothetical protein
MPDGPPHEPGTGPRRPGRRSARLAAAAVLLAGLAVAQPQPAAADVPGPVVLVGTGGLRWDDVGDDTPALTALLQSGSSGVLAIRSLRPTTCPVDGWLAVSAGKRAADAPVSGGGCRAPEASVPTPGGPGSVPRWGGYRTEAEQASFDAVPGLLGRTLARSPAVTTAAVGAGAVIALADADGKVPKAWPGLGSGAAAAPGAGADDAALGRDVQAAVKQANLVVVDVGALQDGGPVGRHDQVLVLDARIGLVVGAAGPRATVLVASLADSGRSTGSGPHLQLLAATGTAPDGSAYGPGLLGSRSTRQDGMAQTTDLLPTLLDAFSVPVPGDAVGAPLLTVGQGGSDQDRLRRLTDLELAAQQVRPIVAWFFNGLILAQLLLYGGATWVLRREREDPRARGRVLRGTRWTAVVFAAVPAATFLANLVPWWRTGRPLLWVTVAVAGFVLPIALMALLGPWRNRLLGPFGVVGGLTAAVLGIDVATGSHLTLSSLMGVQPLVAGRFYGLSNPGFALFSTGMLLAAAAVADALVRPREGRPERRREAVAAVAGIGLLAVLVDGTPGLGSDFGGPPAIIPSFAVLALLVAGVRMTWRRALLVAAGTVLALAALSLLDYLRAPGDRTHLGRFVQTLLDGGAAPVVTRKLQQNLDILVKPISLLLPFAVAFVALVLARPASWGARPLALAYDRSPVLRHALVAWAVLVGLGFALNDSGTAIPAVAATVAIPLLIAVSVRALELDEDRRLAEAVEAARRASRPRRR